MTTAERIHRIHQMLKEERQLARAQMADDLKWLLTTAVKLPQNWENRVALAIMAVIDEDWRIPNDRSQ